MKTKFLSLFKLPFRIGIFISGSNSESFKLRFLFTLLIASFTVLPIYSQVIVSTLAGSGAFGYADGTGTAARFYYPNGVAVDGSGNVYVADNNRIRKITSAGLVSTLAGSGSVGSADGTGTSATFHQPTGVAVDGSGNVYVADYANHKIRKITSAGVVSTVAGSGTIGSADGNGTAATFKYPVGIAVDGSGNLYVADYINHKIRKITSTGLVTTLAGSGSSGSADGTSTIATFSYPSGVAVDGYGNVYVADSEFNKVRKITSTGLVSTLAGTGSLGSADGNGTAATFYGPASVAVDGYGNVYVADKYNCKIRKITSTGLVSTLAGSGSLGSADGNGTVATFYAPSGVAVDGLGNVYVADNSNNKIRKISMVAISTWNGTAWSPSAPTTSTIAVINGNYNTTTNGIFSSAGLTVNAGKTLIIQTGTALTVSGNLINNGTIIKCGSLNVTGTSTGTAVQTSTPPPVSATATRTTGCIFNLAATGANTYTWSPATGLNSTSGQNITSSAKQNIVYTVTGTAANGCWNTFNVTTPVPASQISPPAWTFCSGGNIPLNAKGGTGYSWTPTDGIFPTTGPAVTAKPTVTTTYTVSGTDDNGCNTKGTVTITVNPLPVFALPVTAPSICAGNHVSIKASNETGLNYVWTPTTGLDNPALQTVKATPSQTTLYYVKATNPVTGCNDIRSVTVNVTGAIPPASPTICAGQPANLTATGVATTYTWSGANLNTTSGPSVVATPSTTTVYSVKGTSAACPNTPEQYVTVSVTPLPYFELTPVSASVPLGSSVALTAYGSDNYTWSPSTYLNTTGDPNVTSTPEAAVTYTVSSTTNGCTATKTLPVTVFVPPAGTNARYAIDVATGPVPQGTFYSNTKNNSLVNQLWNDIGQPSDDIFYKFTVNQPSQVKVQHCNTLAGGINDSYMHLLNANGKSMFTNDDTGPLCDRSLRSSMDLGVSAGTYYVVSEGFSTHSGDIKTDIQVLSCSTGLAGSTIANPILIGSNIGACFSYYGLPVSNGCMGNKYGHAGEDIIYKFTLNSPQKVNISSCESAFYDTYITLLNGDLSYRASNDDNGILCPASMNASLSIDLPAGTYYIALEGYSSLCGVMSLTLTTPTTSCPNLRQENTNEREGLSKSDLAEIASFTKTLNVYPNPSVGEMIVDLNIASEATVVLIDMMGIVVAEKQVPAGSNSFKLEGSHLPKGIYIVKVLGTELSKSVIIK